MKKEKDTYFRIIEKIRLEMRKKKLRQQDLADFLGKDKSTISLKMNHGKFTALELIAVCDWLRINLIGWEEKPVIQRKKEKNK